MAREYWRTNYGNGWSKSRYRDGSTRWTKDKGSYKEHTYRDGSKAYSRYIGGGYTKWTGRNGRVSYGKSMGQGYTQWSDGTWTRNRSR